MRLFRAGRSGLLVAALLAITGCGAKKESSEQAEVRAALIRFDAAQAGGDAAGACRSLIAVDEQGRVEVPGGDVEEEREAAAAAGDTHPDAKDDDPDAKADPDAKDAKADPDAKDAKADPDAKDATADPDAKDAESGEADAEARVCERAFSRAASSRKLVRDVRLDVTSIKIAGDKATADTRTRLTRPDGTKLDQRTTRRLARLDGGWRIVITEE